eukprot:6199174-Pleurochrysis_carterae.AAC.2
MNWPPLALSLLFRHVRLREMLPQYDRSNGQICNHACERAMSLHIAHVVAVAKRIITSTIATSCEPACTIPETRMHNATRARARAYANNIENSAAQLRPDKLAQTPRMPPSREFRGEQRGKTRGNRMLLTIGCCLSAAWLPNTLLDTDAVKSLRDEEPQSERKPCAFEKCGPKQKSVESEALRGRGRACADERAEEAQIRRRAEDVAVHLTEHARGP